MCVNVFVCVSMSVYACVYVCAGVQMRVHAYVCVWGDLCVCESVLCVVCVGVCLLVRARLCVHKVYKSSPSTGRAQGAAISQR